MGKNNQRRINTSVAPVAATAAAEGAAALAESRTSGLAVLRVADGMLRRLMAEATLRVFPRGATDGATPVLLPSRRPAAIYLASMGQPSTELTDVFRDYCRRVLVATGHQVGLRLVDVAPPPQSPHTRDRTDGTSHAQAPRHPHGDGPWYHAPLAPARGILRTNAVSFDIVGAVARQNIHSLVVHRGATPGSFIGGAGDDHSVMAAAGLAVLASRARGNASGGADTMGADAAALPAAQPIHPPLPLPPDGSLGAQCAARPAQGRERAATTTEPDRRHLVTPFPTTQTELREQVLRVPAVWQGGYQNRKVLSSVCVPAPCSPHAAVSSSSSSHAEAEYSVLEFPPNRPTVQVPSHAAAADPQIPPVDFTAPRCPVAYRILPIDGALLHHTAWELIVGTDFLLGFIAYAEDSRRIGTGAMRRALCELRRGLTFTVVEHLRCGAWPLHDTPRDMTLEEFSMCVATVLRPDQLEATLN